MTDPALAIAVPLIAGFEGFRSEPYQDSGGVWTQGFGFTYLPDMKRVAADTPAMTQEAATAWLEVFVTKTLATVLQMVDVTISINAAAALTSLAYNEGTGALRNSTLLKLLNGGETVNAANAFMSWVYAGGQYSRGLSSRRAAERALFLTPDLGGAV